MSYTKKAIEEIKAQGWSVDNESLGRLIKQRERNKKYNGRNKVTEQKGSKNNSR